MRIIELMPWLDEGMESTRWMYPEVPLGYDCDITAIVDRLSPLIERSVSTPVDKRIKELVSSDIFN